MTIHLKLSLNSSKNLTSENETLKKINLILAKSIYILFLLIQFIIWYPLTMQKLNHGVCEEKMKKSILSMGLVITLVMGESFLSIWILISVIILYYNYSCSWLSSKKLF